MFRLLTNIPALNARLHSLVSPLWPEHWTERRLILPRMACCSDGDACTTHSPIADGEDTVGSFAADGYALPALEPWMNEAASQPSPQPQHQPVDPTHALFRSEYEQEMESWLRRRFEYICLCYLMLGAVVIALRMWIGFEQAPGRMIAIIASIAAGAGSLAVVSYFYFSKAWVSASREQLIRTASTMILLLGSISLVKNSIVVSMTAERENFILPLFAWHFVACLFLPWTPRESLRPIVPLLGLWMLGVVFLEDATITEKVLKLIFGPGVIIPGLALCALRLKQHSERFRLQMVGKQFFTMRREMAEARSIHENLFPKPQDDGHIRFEYTYTPQRELGGDYVHLHSTRLGVVYVTLLDVTGHGLAAALTVNRLYGELERIFGETPDAPPVEVMTLLNRYIHLTMVKHNIYVTGLCMRVDPTEGKLVWSSAGHPPALLRGANGVVRKLPATNVLLGALDGSEFNGRQSEMEMSPGDAILMYTDGVFEARDRAGNMLGLEKVDSLAHTQPPPRRWPQFIAAAVQKHTSGRNEDDVLVATLTYLSPRPARARQSEIATRAW